MTRETLNRLAWIGAVALLVPLLTVPLLVHGAEKTQMLALTPQPATLSTKFSDGRRELTLAEFRGRPFLLNVWATWCPPCVKEMPALDRLAGKLGPDFPVVVLSTDDGGAAQVEPFLAKLGVKAVRPLYDTEARAFQDFSLRGLPTTLLIDADGRLVARLEGAADWDSPAMLAQLKALAAPLR